MKLVLANIAIKNLDGTDMIEPNGELTAEAIKNAIPQIIYSNTKNVASIVVAQELYKNGESEVNEEQKKDIQEIIEKLEYPAVLTQAILNAFID